jgi:hypothetical protein
MTKLLPECVTDILRNDKTEKKNFEELIVRLKNHHQKFDLDFTAIEDGNNEDKLEDGVEELIKLGGEFSRFINRLGIKATKNSIEAIENKLVSSPEAVKNVISYLGRSQKLLDVLQRPKRIQFERTLGEAASEIDNPSERKKIGLGDMSNSARSKLKSMEIEYNKFQKRLEAAQAEYSKNKQSYDHLIELAQQTIATAHHKSSDKA